MNLKDKVTILSIATCRVLSFPLLYVVAFGLMVFINIKDQVIPDLHESLSEDWNQVKYNVYKVFSKEV